jgi:hypothetical protein
MTTTKIELLTKEEFLQQRNPKAKYHPSSAYDNVLEPEELIQITNGYDRLGFDLYRFPRSPENSFVVTKNHKPIAVFADGDLFLSAPSVKNIVVRFIERKQKVNTIKVVKYLNDQIDAIRGKRQEYQSVLQNLVVGGEPLQVRAETSPPKEGDTIVIVNEWGDVVAMAADEWGATLIVVAKAYRNKGLGAIVGKWFYKYNPNRDSGGFTPAGEQNAIKIWAEAVREFLALGGYTNLYKKGEITKERIDQILSGLPPEAKPIPSKPTEDTKKLVLLYKQHDTESFVLYDSRFIQDQDEKYILARGFLRSSNPVGTFIFAIDYEPEYRKLAHKIMFQIAADAGEDHLYVGEGYGDVLELEGIPEIAVEGDYAYLTTEVLDISKLSQLEKSTRRPFDKYSEIEYALQNEADAKWQ